MDLSDSFLTYPNPTLHPMDADLAHHCNHPYSHIDDCTTDSTLAQLLRLVTTQLEFCCIFVFYSGNGSNCKHKLVMMCVKNTTSTD